MNPTIVEQHPPQPDTYPDRNLALLDHLLGLQVADPERYAAIPEGASLVIVERDDPAFARHNREMALALVDRGERVYVLDAGNLDTPERGILLVPTDIPPGYVNMVLTFPSATAAAERLPEIEALLRDLAAGRRRKAG
jgi:hypothetical protein